MLYEIRTFLYKTCTICTFFPNKARCTQFGKMCVFVLVFVRI